MQYIKKYRRKLKTQCTSSNLTYSLRKLNTKMIESYLFLVLSFMY
jgi:hypothetical protein